MSDLMCGECRAGDHKACYGGAWDNDYDQPAPCRCWAYNHKPYGWDAPPEVADVDPYEESQRMNRYEKGFGW
jgi:hypothetical protein